MCTDMIRSALMDHGSVTDILRWGGRMRLEWGVPCICGFGVFTDVSGPLCLGIKGDYCSLIIFTTYNFISVALNLCVFIASLMFPVITDLSTKQHKQASNYKLVFVPLRDLDRAERQRAM